ncbi:prostate-associated microseminoprotein isoform X1 [Sorex araneus]|uniref:prostate-associated microseminoprotein isoform X1 n=1 Tax=Sorex araneus TaxID=42254 RepID=UPI00243369D5|nr:prostate-associated microseminoprotein isoform X1 [Sorex araneus]
MPAEGTVVHSKMGLTQETLQRDILHSRCLFAPPESWAVAPHCSSPVWLRLSVHHPQEMPPSGSGRDPSAHTPLESPCHYEGKYYSLGESWLRGDCFQCTCLHPVGVGCCDTSQHPIDFPAECELRREADTCQFSLVQKADPRLPCKGGGPDPEWGSANTPAAGAPAPHSS